MKTDENILIETDRKFAQLALEKGTSAAFAAYADDAAIKLNDNQAPMFGKEAIIAAFKGIPADAPPLRWKPLKAEIAASNDLGYTFGTWGYTFTKEEVDTTITGVYVSIWKKQEDGTWKFVLDGGNTTPDPTEWLGSMP